MNSLRKGVVFSLKKVCPNGFGQRAGLFYRVIHVNGAEQFFIFPFPRQMILKIRRTRGDNMALLKGPPENLPGGGPCHFPFSGGLLTPLFHAQFPTSTPYSNPSSPTSPPFSPTFPSSETNFCIPILSRPGFCFPETLARRPNPFGQAFWKEKTTPFRNGFICRKGELSLRYPHFPPDDPLGEAK